MAENLHITGGPSKWDLMISLFHGDHLRREKVDFSVYETSSKLAVVINSVERESGSGENWNFTGYSSNMKVRGYYETHSRTGWMVIED
jgi:hypothetical protein